MLVRDLNMNPGSLIWQILSKHLGKIYHSSIKCVLKAENIILRTDLLSENNNSVFDLLTNKPFHGLMLVLNHICVQFIFKKIFKIQIRQCSYFYPEVYKALHEIVF